MKNHNFLKKTSLLLATVALLAMMVAPSYAAITQMYVQWEAPWTGYYEWLDDGVANETVAYYITGNGEYLSYVTVKLANSSAFQDGTYTMRLFGSAVNGSCPNVTKSGVALEQSSTNLAGNTINTPSMWDATEYTFMFANTTLLTNGERYWLGICVNGAATSYHLNILGNHFSLTTALSVLDTGWAGGHYTPLTRVYTSDTEGGGGTPTPPTDLADTTSWDTLISSFTSFIVPIFVVMLPVILLMLITRSNDKWIILIGLTIGVGLGYYFALVPLWVVFLVAIGLIGMAYQSVRGGG